MFLSSNFKKCLKRKSIFVQHSHRSDIIFGKLSNSAAGKSL